MRAPSITIMFVAASACGGDSELPIKAECNPLGANHCMTPWPSSAFEVDDASTATGRRLAIPKGTLPTNIDNIPTDPTGWNVADGFSPAAPMVMSFPGGVSAQGLTPPDNMDSSLAADAPTVILDMTTGTRVAHFAEVDVPAEATPDSQALFLRPAQRLTGGHRYAVAITKRVKAKDGSDLVVPAGFAALRDGASLSHPLLNAIRPRFGEVLAALETAGFAKQDLVVAWDFTVASDEFIRRDTSTAVERIRAALDTHPITFDIKTDMPVDDMGRLTRRIEGTFDAPLLLSNNGNFVPNTRIVRDADGLPAVQGFYRIPFVAIVPACAETAAAPVPMVIYGHGLLGSSGETGGGVQRDTAAEMCAIFAGTDMRGMSGQDLPAVATALNEMTHADEVMEVLEQGIANHAALERALRTTFADTLFVANGKKLADKNTVYYYGISQGGIFGTAVVDYLGTLPRAVLGVGAANYSMLLERSTDWPMYRVIVNGAYPDALDVALAISLFQMRWDKVEGSGIVNHVIDGGGHGPPHQLLMEIAIGDEQVPNIGSYWQARSMNIPVLDPTPFSPWHVDVKAGPLSSALVIYDGGAPPVPSTNTPAANVGMHSMPRKQPATRRQITNFFANGAIVNECAGACVCTTTACN